MSAVELVPLPAGVPFESEASYAAVDPLMTGTDAVLTRRLVAKRLSEYRARAVEFLWNERIPASELTMLAGDGGLGKSTFAAHLAALVTTGQVVGPLKTRRVTVVLGEDDPARVLAARYRAAGADMNFVTVASADEGAGEETLSLPEDLAMLKEHVALERPELLIVDPLAAHMSGAIDSHRDGGKGGLRAILNPLSLLAQTYGTTVVVCVHLNKGSGPAGQRIGGSAAIRNAARNVLMLAEHPQARSAGEDDGRRILGHEKCNYGPLQASLNAVVSEATAVSEAGVPLLRSDGSSATTSRMVVGEVSDVDYRDAIRTASVDGGADDGGSQDALSEAIEFLMEELENGPMPSKQLDAMAADAGIAKRTLARARKQLGAKSTKNAGRWTVSLPGTVGALGTVGTVGESDEGPKSAKAANNAKTAGLRVDGAVGTDDWESAL